MVWSCFCAASPGYITMVGAAMDGEGYRAVLASDHIKSLYFLKGTSCGPNIPE
ncbi:hypothetical protein GQ54DRAFT_260411 [Martensiomyces pterosporus]|nr:hypothetical protein GQ54DRAFT_260411 [Martensiomyces pterosporus]